MHRAHRTASRLTALLAAALLGLCVFAAQAAQLSPSVVLVLKLVAADRVQPITGVVVSDGGLVLVPAGFVTEEAEIIVLDGGADIIAHGRRAEVVARDTDTGLALLAADGLARPGVTLSASAPDAGRELTLQAYPPAQSIAAGEGPLLIPARLTGAGGVEGIAGAPLPNVTGALLDACGYLVALRVAGGTQSLAPAPAATLARLEGLAATIDAVNPGVPRAACALPVETASSTAQPAPGQQPEDERTSAAAPIQSSVEKDLRSRPSPVTPGPPVTIELAGEESAEPAKAGQSDQAPAPMQTEATPAWLLPAALLVLVLLAWRFALARRAGRDGSVQPASDEPDTVRLFAAESEPGPVMRSGRGGDAGLPRPDALPEGCDGVVVLENPAGPETRAFCPVNTDNFDIVIGRGGGDLAIAHAAVSRRHARIAGRNGVLTIEDLGSSNGTYIDRVPCLPGEVMRLEAGMNIWLGEFHCRVVLLGGEQLA